MNQITEYFFSTFFYIISLGRVLDGFWRVPNLIDYFFLFTKGSGGVPESSESIIVRLSVSEEFLMAS